MKVNFRMASLLISGLFMAACAPQGSAFSAAQTAGNHVATSGEAPQQQAVDAVRAVSPTVSSPKMVTTTPAPTKTTTTIDTTSTSGTVAPAGVTASINSTTVGISDTTASGPVTGGGTPEIPINPPPDKPKTVSTETGMMRPTIYYVPVFETQTCSTDKREALHGTRGETLIDVCPEILAECTLEGSCAVKEGGVLRHFNISTKVNGEERFFETSGETCPYGFGVESACLDPFYTLAADLTIYKTGDVIFIPAAVGLELPNGKKHTGFFVVRDKGRGVTGKGRFDFFSGYFSWKNPQNPFVKMGFADLSTHIPYYKISGEKAEQILQSRDFPKLPAR